VKLVIDERNVEGMKIREGIGEFNMEKMCMKEEMKKK